MIRGSSLCGQLAARVAMVVWFAVIAGGRLSPLRNNAEASAQELGLWMSGQFGDEPTRQGASGAH